jgi:excisionase family DNA binding protein
MATASTASTASIAEQIEGIDHALTAEEIATMLSVSKIMIYKLARKNRIPHIRIGSLVRFCGKRVAEWIRSKEVN